MGAVPYVPRAEHTRARNNVQGSSSLINTLASGLMAKKKSGLRKNVDKSHVLEVYPIPE